MTKKIATTVIISLLSFFLFLAFVFLARNLPQQVKNDPMSDGQTETTTGLVATEPTSTNSTIPYNTTSPEIIPQTTAPPPTQEPTTPPKNENPVTPTSTPTKPPTQPTTKPQELPKWKQMYINHVTVWRTRYDHFALVYIDGDDIPELYMY